MEVDEEEPPVLVNVIEAEQDSVGEITSHMQDASLKKVPLTIVTGTSPKCHKLVFDY